MKQRYLSEHFARRHHRQDLHVVPIVSGHVDKAVGDDQELIAGAALSDQHLTGSPSIR